MTAGAAEAADRGTAGRHRAADRGASAFAATWWGLAMLAVALAVAAGGADLAAARATARAAADAAALAGAGAHPFAGGDGGVCEAADRLAAAGDAELAACRVDHGHRAEQLRVEVRVTAEPATGLLRAGVGTVSATAAAGLAPAES